MGMIDPKLKISKSDTSIPNKIIKKNILFSRTLKILKIFRKIFIFISLNSNLYNIHYILKKYILTVMKSKKNVMLIEFDHVTNHIFKEMQNFINIHTCISNKPDIYSKNFQIRWSFITMNA